MEPTKGPGKSGFTDTNPASNPLRPRLLNTFGKMAKGLTAWVGLMTSSVEKWWVEARSYEITGASISISIFFFTLVFGYLAAIKFERSRNDSFWLNGKEYQMIGLGNAPGHKDVYIPVYKEVQ